MIKNLEKLSINEIEDLIKELEQKRINLKIKEDSKKNLINSLSGALGNIKFPLYNVKLSNSMTSYGRYYIKSIIKRLNDYLTNVYDYNGEEALIYTHTDSLYLNLDPYIKTLDENLTDKEIEIKLKEKSLDLLKIIEAQFSLSNKIFNSNENTLVMKLEGIYKNGIWCSASNYFIQNKKNEIKVVGLSLTKSSTPKFCRDLLKDSLGIFLNKENQDIQDFILKSKEKFKKQDLINLAFTESSSNVEYGFVDNKYKLSILNEIFHLKNILNSKINLSLEEIKNIDYKFKELDKLIFIKEIDLNKFKSILNDLISNENKLIENKVNLIYHKINEFNNSIYINPLFEDNFIFKKGIRISTQGAIIFNKYILKNKLNLKKINSNEKIKYIYLKDNNPFNSSVISFKTEKDIEALDLSKYIDYDLQFEKSFIKPLEQITMSLKIDIKNNQNSKKSYDYFESLF